MSKKASIVIAVLLALVTFGIGMLIININQSTFETNALPIVLPAGWVFTEPETSADYYASNPKVGPAVEVCPGDVAMNHYTGLPLAFGRVTTGGCNTGRDEANYLALALNVGLVVVLSVLVGWLVYKFTPQRQ